LFDLSRGEHRWDSRSMLFAARAAARMALPGLATQMLVRVRPLRK
jgi:hypothetical protein